MQGPRSAKSGEHKIARIMAALDGNNFQSLGHGMIDNIDDSSRGCAGIDTKEFGEPDVNGICGCRMIDRKIAPKQRFFIKVAEHEVAVGDGRLSAAARVASGAGIGTGALGTDAQRSSPVDPCDRSASGRYFGQIDDR